MEVVVVVVAKINLKCSSVNHMNLLDYFIMTRNLKPCGRKVGRKILLPRDYLWKPGCHEVNVTVAKAAQHYYIDTGQPIQRFTQVFYW